MWSYKTQYFWFRLQDFLSVLIFWSFHTFQNTDWKNNIVQPFIPTFEDFQTGSHLGWNLKQRPQTESQQLDNVKNDDRKDNIAAVQVVENNYKGRHTSSPNVHQTDDHTHLCFCCEENELRPFFAQDLQRRKKRTVRIGNDD